jgi:hypothetical protein
MTLRRAFARALEGLRDRSAGALVLRLPDGSQAGAIFAADGRICWATSAGSRELSELLQKQSALPRERLEDALRRRREEEAALGQGLSPADLVGEDRLRRELLRDICQAVRALFEHDGSWEWVRHDGLTYSAALTFGAADVASGLAALEHPTLVERARQRLADAMLRGQHGFTVDDGELMPLAHIGCGGLEARTLFDLAKQAQELMARGRTASAKGLIAVIDSTASSIWREGDLLHVVIDPDGSLAVGRLVSQLAAVTAAA